MLNAPTVLDPDSVALLLFNLAVLSVSSWRLTGRSHSAVAENGC
jgi:hypothetical protein